MESIASKTRHLQQRGFGQLTISQAAGQGAGFTMTGQTFPITLSAGQTAALMYSSANG